MLILVQFMRRMRHLVQTRMALKVLVFVVLFVFLGGLGFYAFESRVKPELTMADSFWWAFVTMTTVGYGDLFPVTAEGRFLIAIPAMVAGGGVLAYGLSVVTTFLIEAKTKELRGMNTFTFNNHIVLINYPGEAKVVEMVDEIKHDRKVAGKQVVLLTDQIEEISETLLKLQVNFVKGSPINEDSLQRAGVARASDAILFARSERDENSDSFNLGVLVALSAVNPQLRSVVECVSPMHRALMLKAGARTAICVTELSTQLLAQARDGLEIQALFTDLASHRTPQQVDAVPFELTSGKTMTFGTLANSLGSEDVLLIGVRRGNEQFVNPGSSFEIRDGDFLLVISSSRPDCVRRSA